MGFTQAALQAAVAAKKRSGRTNQFTAGTATEAGEKKRTASIAKTMTGTKKTKESKNREMATKIDIVRREMHEQPDDLPSVPFVTYGGEEEYSDF